MFAGLIRLVTGVQDRWVGLDPLLVHSSERPDEGTLVQRVYYANHASHLDAPVIWASLPPALRARTRPVAARDYWDSGPLRRWLSQDVLRAILIDREQGPRTPEQAAAAVAPVEAALREGDSLILFPEGTRNPQPDDGLLPFKSGLYHLARQFPAVQIVPTFLSNLNRILPKGEVAPVPLLARVTFGAPLRLEPGEDKDAFLYRARTALSALAEGEDPQ